MKSRNVAYVAIVALVGAVVGLFAALTGLDLLLDLLDLLIRRKRKARAVSQ